MFHITTQHKFNAEQLSAALGSHYVTGAGAAHPRSSTALDISPAAQSGIVVVPHFMWSGHTIVFAGGGIH